MIRREEVYKIGRLGKTHGVRGEISFLLDDDVFDRTDADYLILDIDGILVPFFIEEYRFKTDSNALMKFDGIDTQERARELTGCDVYFPRSLSDEDETNVSWAELVGYSLIDSNSGKTIGEIAAIDDTTINILFELTDGKLIPASEELIQQTQALEVIEEHADLYEVYCLTANNKVQQLAEQAHKFKPAAIVIANEQRYDELKALMSDLPDIKVYAGAQALDEIVEAGPIDMVLTAMVGFSGLNPTIHAIKAGKTICLANKETLVVAGELILQLAQQYHTPILPVDSEHSAIFQSLVGEDQNPIEKILLTASGGPFRLKSASMMNKGFEVIEAKWLFGVEADRIQVLVHPQSIVHSAVQFQDGSVKAQLGVPDMRLPIQYAFSFPQRLHLSGERLDLFKAQHLEFFEPDLNKFRCLALAFEAIKKGGNMPCGR